MRFLFLKTTLIFILPDLEMNVGAVVAAWSKLCQGSFEPTMGEVTALFYAASLCRELGIHEVVFEGAFYSTF
jgi:hypothetical protein